MDSQEYTCLVISEFNMANFVGYLNNDQDFPKVNAAAGPFGQIMQILVGSNLESLKSDADLTIIWTRPQSVIQSFKDILEYKRVSFDDVLREVDEFASLVFNMKDRVSAILVPTWVIPSYHRGYGMIDMRNDFGIANLLMRMNLRLSEKLDEAQNIYMLNTQKWIELAGKNAFNPKLWYMGKIAFGNEVFKEAAKDVKSVLTGIRGASKKMVILDLDDTLWGGVVGEVGWESLRLGGHDSVGEAFVDFQNALKSLTNRGLLLGIVSKNEESIALEAIESHPEMVLRLDDFVGWRINWKDKAQNIVELVSDLNLGLQSVVFIDDNPVERARVKDALPEILVPDLPEDKTLYTKTLLSLRCFDTPVISKEDLERAKMYASERQRNELKNKVASVDEWLKTLGTRVRIEELNAVNLPRATQLLNKTNQMNLSTRRMTESELITWAQQEGRKFWTLRISDKFGDAGLTGLISLEKESEIGRVTDFVLSCRVMGRKIEETMLYKAIGFAQSIGIKEIYARFIPTQRNRPCLRFFEASGFEYDGDNIFKWKLDKEYELPDCIEIIE